MSENAGDVANEDKTSDTKFNKMLDKCIASPKITEQPNKPVGKTTNEINTETPWSPGTPWFPFPSEKCDVRCRKEI